MKIAVNASSFFSNSHSVNDLNSFAHHCLSATAAHPEHSFLFIFDKPYPTSFLLPDNATSIVKGPEINSLIKNRIWHHLKIPAILKKYEADVFLSEKIISLKTKVPQILFFPDLTFLHQPSFVEKRYLSFYKKNTALFLKKANTIIVRSVFMKNELIDNFKTDKEKIILCKKIISTDFVPIQQEAKEQVKEKYTAGNEYFIYYGTISPQKNLLNVLKAFSAFKKRQRSNMQLIISGNPGAEYDSFIESLKLYRFNNEVKVMENSPHDEITKIIAAAYAMLYCPVYETSSIAPLTAMKCEVPVIVSAAGLLPEICGEAALYADPGNFKDIAEKMMLLFKDEKERSHWIEKGKNQVTKYTEEKALDIFSIIENTVKKNPFK
jgi:glycosyltransferase involved in cell wall biosynthesis